MIHRCTDATIDGFLRVSFTYIYVVECSALTITYRLAPGFSKLSVAQTACLATLRQLSQVLKDGRYCLTAVRHRPLLASKQQSECIEL
jgi:hypothetical protein